MDNADAATTHAAVRSIWLRLLVPLGLGLAIAVLWMTHHLLTERFTESTRNRAEVRLTLYSGNLYSELQRNSIVPQLLSRDPELIGALQTRKFVDSSRRLLSVVDEIGAASMMLLDEAGRTVAATNRRRLGETHRSDSFFIEAQRASGTVFTREERETGGYHFYYSRRIDTMGKLLGVIVVEVNLSQLEAAWSRTIEGIMVLDSEGEIILATENRWRGMDESGALALQPVQSTLERAFTAAQDWTGATADVYLSGQAMMRVERRVPFHGWRMVSFTPYASVRERVNGILALEIMGFALILAVTFFYLNRRAANKVNEALRESSELRLLNIRLQREIAERRKVERTLEVAEQTLEQSSKLAALGEMSAAVSHELNQPLAAMKTYLAGARLLLERRRPEEAAAALRRIDDLINRMSAITRQLKSYARKGADSFAPVDVRDAVNSALAMMEPQLRSQDVAITRTMPTSPTMMMGDRLRLEQVIINLLRNAIDATKSVADPSVDILLTQGDMINLTVRDNGEGIEGIENLFEPFYTTKQPGDGVGLGLAISSGIVAELGGRLTARHGHPTGAVFELELPTIEQTDE